MSSPLKVGLIGCGVISHIYLTTLRRSHLVEVVACGALDQSQAEARAREFGIAEVKSPDEIITDPGIEAILNLTIPAAHADITRKALLAGKHVYCEKPFVTDWREGAALLELAETKGLLLGNAPDTFLGGRWQTVQRLISEGAIGAPTGVSAFVGTHGVERHHPNPDFYYQTGGGPLLDLGPYYLTAMVVCLGPLARVAGMSRRTFAQRQIESQPRAGEWMDVEVDTHVNALLAFERGPIGTMTMSFDVWDSQTPRLEIYGEEGSICIPDPDPVFGANVFGGEVWIRHRETSRWTYQPRKPGHEHWQVAENHHGFNDNSRGLGLIDLAVALNEGRQPRASGALANHVVEAMHGILTSQTTGQFWAMDSSCTLVPPLPENFAADVLS